MERRLSGLLQSLPDPLSGPDISLSGIVDDSRLVQPGMLFVAVAGETHDGHDYLEQAAAAGAVAAVGERPASLPIPYVQVPDSRLALSYLASAWHGHPSRQLTMIGVTGTDGKTTTASMIHAILTAAGRRAGLVTSVQAVIGAQQRDTGFHVTTPSALQVQAFLAEMVQAGLTDCVMEVTSHGLAQARVAACRFNVAVVTNIAHEHLDYHGSYESYREAKAILFRQLLVGPGASGDLPTAVLNRDDSSYEFLKSQTTARPIDYGRGGQVTADRIEDRADGVSFELRSGSNEWPVKLALSGGYNVSNALAAFAATVNGLGISPETAIDGLQALRSVPGRMEPIQMGQPFEAIVDFAHTPNALRQALSSVRARLSGRLIAVFGSAGLRDRAKRRLMAEAAAELADITILTAEDPRTESLNDILEEMRQAAETAGAVADEDLLVIPDRGLAIQTAVEIAAAGDVVIACGKGHEQSMCFGEIEHAWDDRTAMRAALAHRLGVPGPEMPWLPTRSAKAGDEPWMR